jgi:hypothetical protein
MNEFDIQNQLLNNNSQMMLNINYQNSQQQQQQQQETSLFSLDNNQFLDNYEPLLNVDEAHAGILSNLLFVY